MAVREQLLLLMFTVLWNKHACLKQYCSCGLLFPTMDCQLGGIYNKAKLSQTSFSRCLVCILLLLTTHCTIVLLWGACVWSLLFSWITSFNMSSHVCCTTVHGDALYRCPYVHNAIGCTLQDQFRQFFKR